MIRRLERLANSADELELTLPNGALVGNVLMGIALDLGQQLAAVDSNIIQMTPKP